MLILIDITLLSHKNEIVNYLSHYYENLFIIYKKDGVILAKLFWERFYSLCLKKGTKPNPVADELHISSGILTKWKNLGTLPNGENLIKIADYLDCSVDYLLGRTDVPEVNREVKPLSITEQFQKSDDRKVAAYGESASTIK